MVLFSLTRQFDHILFYLCRNRVKKIFLGSGCKHDWKQHRTLWIHEMDCTLYLVVIKLRYTWTVITDIWGYELGWSMLWRNISFGKSVDTGRDSFVERVNKTVEIDHTVFDHDVFIMFVFHVYICFQCDGHHFMY